MSDTVTTEACAAAKERCVIRVFAAIDSVRVTTQQDIAIIREAVQSIDRAVAQIKGYLNINGVAAGPHPHHRDSDEGERLHQRMTDAIVAAELAAAAATKATAAVAADKADPGAMPALPWRAWVALAALFVMVVGLALVAGREGLTIWPKPHAVPAPLVSR